jgi:hypothetical protein
MWHPSLLQLGIKPWEMADFTGAELNELSRWNAEQAKAAKAASKSPRSR